MPNHRHAELFPGVTSRIWPSGGRHVWPSGVVTPVQEHERGHLVYPAAGVLAVHTGAGTSVVPANRVAWIPATVPHSERAHGATDMRIVFLDAPVARLVGDQPVVFLASTLAREAVLTLTGDRYDDEAAPAYDPAAAERLRRVLVDELRDVPEEPLHFPEARDDRLQAIARILQEDPANNATLAELGRSVGASPRTLSRLFQGEFGMTFYEWRTQLRIYHALVLLAEGHDTTGTALACGWANPSTFIAAFANLVGTTPGRYRADGS